MFADLRQDEKTFYYSIAEGDPGAALFWLEPDPLQTPGAALFWLEPEPLQTPGAALFWLEPEPLRTPIFLLGLKLFWHYFPFILV